VAQTVDPTSASQPAKASAPTTAPATPPAPAPHPEGAPTLPPPQETAAPTTQHLRQGIRRRSASRRTRVTVRHLGPLSVLKLSLIFYFCVWLAIFLGLLFLFMILQAVGVIDRVEEMITTTGFSGNEGATFQIDPAWVFPRLFVIGAFMSVVWSVIKLFVAFLYNLISDIVGGVEITLAEKK
jgi:Transmembrane domain of unknown function (DUF3566)